VSALVNIPDRVFFATKHIPSSLTALDHITGGHVLRLSLRLLLKLWPFKFLHHGRRIFPTFRENTLCLNFRVPELSLTWISTDFRINLEEEDVVSSKHQYLHPKRFKQIGDFSSELK